METLSPLGGQGNGGALNLGFQGWRSTGEPVVKPVKMNLFGELRIVASQASTR